MVSSSAWLEGHADGDQNMIKNIFYHHVKLRETTEDRLMPYSAEHKQETRNRIVRNARKLFNRHGFAEVSIDQIMASAGLTRGGFYNHFQTKDELYVEAMDRYSADQMAEMSAQPMPCGPETALQIVKSYVSREQLEDLEGQCPLIALPSDVSRTTPAVRAAYQRVLEGLVGMFESNLADAVGADAARRQGLALAATCIGAMVLARTVEDDGLATEICDAALDLAAQSTLSRTGLAA
jgi:TetR/AcrR family transcriptional repressor of nem operon